ncbi:hypothetical protein [Ferrimonas aestuarii]|uniref:Uncharacterized protein n=1 Tax=Ferrimonas aestuarii TaxID=2569539 RepID=A0A4U1BM49_9GAMM|nr:hypothetical protein [Ferrimonas aestuarii]TKB54541.1 hypothetical protein FCL42_12065 [Ferrimonas aestuarii]
MKLSSILIPFLSFLILNVIIFIAVKEQVPFGHLIYGLVIGVWACQFPIFSANKTIRALNRALGEAGQARLLQEERHREKEAGYMEKICNLEDEIERLRSR